MANNNRDRVEVFIFTFLWGYTINFIGSISLSEIYLLLISPFLLKEINFKKFRALRTISKLYLIYLIIQILSEIINENSFNNSIRGIAVTVISFLSFIYLFKKLIKDVYLIIVIFIGLIFRNLIFPSSLSEHSQMAFFKFYISPLLLSFMCIITYYLLKYNKKTFAVLLIFSFGLFFIANDSRSSGILSITVALFLQFGEFLFSKKNIAVVGIITAVLLFISYYLYYIYINNVLSGSFGGVHSYEQVSRLDNPYNPLELLKTGRAEAFVALEAIKDSPIIGHGTWAVDKSGKYTFMNMELHKDNNFELAKEIMSLGGNSNVIPSHSVIMGAGVYNGIFALILVAFIIVFFLRKGIKAIDFNSPYSAILLKTIVDLAWVSSFSTISQLKNDLPPYFAVILVLYYYKIRVSPQKLFSQKNVTIDLK